MYIFIFNKYVYILYILMNTANDMYIFHNILLKESYKT